MSKILFCDLDGTLLKDNKQVSAANRNAILKMMEAGHYFVICSGRSVDSGRKIAKDLGLDAPGCYMICFNGAVIYDCGNDQVIKAHMLSETQIMQLFEKAKQAGLYIQTYGEKNIIATEHTKELDFYRFRANMTYEVCDNLSERVSQGAPKCLLVSLEGPDKLQKFQEDNLDWTSEKMNSFFSCEEYLEYVPIGVDKGSAVRELAEYLQIKIEDTIAVGDERNDIAMLKTAGTGVAMKNSHPEVLSCADVVTLKDNNHDGVEEVIKKYIFSCE